MAKGLPGPENGSPETIVEMSRLNNLSDGVFAIALTLLVLDIRLPESATGGDLSTSVLGLASKLLVYVISFIVIGGAWGSHQRMLSQIKRGDGLLVWFNLLSLLFVTLIPASANLLGRFPSAFLAIAFFAVDVILIQLGSLWLWRHASAHGLVNPTLDPRVIDSIGRRLTLNAAVFALSLLIALWNPPVVYLVWIVLFVVIFATDWLSWQQAIKTMRVSVPLNGATHGQIGVTYRDGSLQVHSGAPAQSLIEGVCGGGANIQIARDDGLVNATLGSRSGQSILSRRYPWTWGPTNLLDWELNINPRLALTLDIAAVAAKTDLDLSETRVAEIRLKANASSVDLTLPKEAGYTDAKIETSSSFLTIRIPPGVAARIRQVQTDSGLEIDPTRFDRVPGTSEYYSADIETAENRVNILLTTPLSAVKIV